MDIIIIIAAVHAGMLFDRGWLRTQGDYGDNQIMRSHLPLWFMPEM
ncbi:MAG: hypothetical protein GYB65_14915 [Chloroflexi bacterium]|nr:hypothetical protein [Chloroflexota bacterium]